WWEPLRTLILSRFESQATEMDRHVSGPLTYVVKEPGSHAAPLLTELFPQSKLIFLLRDGRDVVDSWLAAYREGSWAIPGGAFPVAREGRVPLIRWLSAVWVYRSLAVRRAFDARPPADRVLLRYETLRANTTVCMRAICEVLGLKREGLDEVVARHSFERLPSDARGPRSETRSARPGSWRENLSAEEQAAMHEVMAATLAEFGYESALETRMPAAS
ncbi:MAG TPA: sulfotransferase, partial [Solirubrobacterales bacterium]